MRYQQYVAPVSGKDVIDHLDSPPSYVFHALSAGHFYLVRIIVPLIEDGWI
jgi:hypothetical protein